MTPPVSFQSQAIPGTGDSGQASSQRTNIASRPPMIIMKSPSNRNWRPIIL